VEADLCDEGRSIEQSYGRQGGSGDDVEGWPESLNQKILRKEGRSQERVEKGMTCDSSLL
jgi:hypothetical protein